MTEYLYLNIYNDIREKIMSGQLANGQRVPTEKEIMAQYGVSRITAIKAFQKLENEKLIKRIKGNGTFVTYTDMLTFRKAYIPLNLHSKNIAFVAPCSIDIVSNILSEFQKIAISHGYNVSIFDTTIKNVSIAELLRTVSNGDFCSIIFRPDQNEIFDIIPVLQGIIQKKIPLIFLDSDIPFLRVPCVKSNNFLGGYKMAECLIEHGHKNIAIVFSDLNNPNEQDRFGGYLRALIDNNIEYNSQNTILYDKNCLLTLPNSNFKTIKDNLKSIIFSINCPTAFFCLYDQMAALLEQHALEMGIKIPDKFSIVGYNNVEICEQMIIPLTSVDQNCLAIANRVFELINEMINGNPVKLEHLIDPMLCLRDSLKNICP